MEVTIQCTNPDCGKKIIVDYPRTEIRNEDKPDCPSCGFKME